jgi:hypothetical protein
VNAQDILSIVDTKVESVTVPEWNNQTVFVRSITAAERETLAAQIEKESKKPSPNVAALICACVISDAAGARLFTDTHAVELGKKNGAALERIVKASNKLNGFGTEKQEEKNS